MSTAWSTEQVLALAPDASSAKAGKELAAPRKWVSLGCAEDVLWGECQGSGAAPYQTKVGLGEPAFHCSCPSRKLPCKHALGLFLLWVGQPSALAPGEPPAWVGSWMEGRSKRAEQKAQKEKATQEKRKRGEASIDPEARRKREAARQAKVAAGLDELEVWLGDLVRQGLASVQGQPASLWERQARRLIDAQAPGVARRLLRIEALPTSGDSWHVALLEHLARLHLLVEGHRRLGSLRPEAQADVRAVVGYPTDLDEVRSAPGVRDVWRVVGQRAVNDVLEARLRIQRTWLIGRDSGRPALILDFAHGTQPFETALLPGSLLDAELAFFPGALPLRALLRQRHTAPEPLDALVGHPSVAPALAAYADSIAVNPWLELYPMVLENVVLQERGGAWWVRVQRRAADDGGPAAAGERPALRQRAPD